MSYWAYMPAPLPPKIEWSEQMVGGLSAADRALGRLAGIGQNLPNPYLLIGAFKRREAVLSSRIEGTQASLSDLVLFEARAESSPSVPDVVEVANYVAALDYGLARQSTLPMSKKLIREMHERLMRGVRGEEKTPGEFRHTQNWIGPPGCTLNQATFVPPPPDALHDCLDAFEHYLHQPSSLPALVRLALIHYQFEAIHPFLDGNGRIGRLLITLLLCMDGVLPQPMLYLSAYFEKNRSAYYDGLLKVSQHGAWEEWIAYFLRGVAEEALDAADRARRLIDLRATYQTRLQKARASALPLRLVDKLFDLPALTVASARKTLGVTTRSVQASIDRLADAGIIHEVTGKARNRVWLAREISEMVQ